MSEVNDIPEHCPGTKSETAGKSNACQGCPNQPVCSSGILNHPDPAIEKIKARMSLVKRKLLVVSGKGGVGKSTVAALIARYFAHCDEKKNIAILDIDICGPSMPRIMGVLGEQVHQSGSGWSPVFVQENLCVMSIGFLLSSSDEAVIWRGPRKNGIIKQFLSEVDWGDALDCLVIDTPPGTSDEHLSIAQYLKDVPGVYAIVITTPQEVSLLDVRKEIDFLKKVGIPVLGVIENMSGFKCPKCSVRNEIFPQNSGGAKAMCDELKVPFAGSLPLDPNVTKSCDEGVDPLEDFEKCPLELKNVIDSLTETWLSSDEFETD